MRDPTRKVALTVHTVDLNEVLLYWLAGVGSMPLYGDSIGSDLEQRHIWCFGDFDAEDINENRKGLPQGLPRSTK